MLPLRAEYPQRTKNKETLKAKRHTKSPIPATPCLINPLHKAALNWSRNGNRNIVQWHGGVSQQQQPPGQYTNVRVYNILYRIIDDCTSFFCLFVSILNFTMRLWLSLITILASLFAVGLSALSNGQSVLNIEHDSFRTFQHREFPSHLIRIKEQNDNVCDAGSKQYTGWLDFDGKHMFFCMYTQR